MSRRPMDQKSPAMKALIDKVFPGTQEALENNLCPSCKGSITAFRNEKSQREWLISGLCQKCQDSTFGSD